MRRPIRLRCGLPSRAAQLFTDTPQAGTVLRDGARLSPLGLAGSWQVTAACECRCVPGAQR